MIHSLRSVKRFFHHATPHSVPEEERKNHLVILFALNASVFALLMFIVRYTLEGSSASQTIWLLPLASVLSVLSLLFIKFQNNSRIATNALLVMGTLIVFARAMSTGGILSPASLWLVIMPTFAFLLLPLKQALSWMMASLIALVLLSYPDVLNLTINQQNSSVEIKLAVLIPLILMLSFMMYLFESEREKNERKIRKVEADLAISNRLLALNKMSGGMAHEINNPLAVIKTHCHVMGHLAKETQAVDLTDSLSEINEGILKIEGIVNALRSFTKDDFYGEVGPIETFGIIQEALNDKKALLRERGIKIILAQEEKIEIFGIREFTLRILSSLIQNSIDAISGSSEPWIRISTRVEKENLKIYVSDSGSPIPKKILDRMFDPFFSTKKIGENPGLGLTISYNLMRLQKGTLSFDSNSKENAFVLSFPVTNSPAV